MHVLELFAHGIVSDEDPEKLNAGKRYVASELCIGGDLDTTGEKARSKNTFKGLFYK